MISRLGPRRTVHHAGTYLLLIATIMHLIPVLTIPVTNMDILKVENRAVSLEGGYPAVRMGTFGYCVSIKDSPEGDKPEVCQSEWGYDIHRLIWDSDTEFSLRAGPDNTTTTRDSDTENDNDDDDKSIKEKISDHMGGLTGMMTALNAFSFALCAAAFLVSLVISMCFITSSYVATWVVSAVAAIGTMAAAASDYRWAAYVRHAVLQANSSSSDEEPAGSIRYGIGAATLTVALVIQAIVLVSGFVVCCLERRHDGTFTEGSSRKRDRSERMKKIDDDRLYDDESLDGEDTTYRPPKAANGYRGVSNP